MAAVKLAWTNEKLLQQSKFSSQFAEALEIIMEIHASKAK